MESNASYGVHVVLVGLFMILVYAGYWVVVVSLNKVLGVVLPTLYWLDAVLYAVFWVGVSLFAVGVVMVVVGVILDAMEMKAKYASLKKAKA